MNTTWTRLPFGPEGRQDGAAGRRLIAAVTLLALTSALLASAPVDDQDRGPAVAKLGEKAPGWKLIDSRGQKRELADYAGKIVVLEWVDWDCAIVQRHYRSRSMQDTYREAKGLYPSIVWLAINSKHSTTPETNNFAIQQYGIKRPVLLDADGAVGRRYDARRAPEMFVIDREGILRYQGAIDDNRLGDKDAKDVTNHVLGAVEQIVKEEAVSPDRVKPYGCRIKYRR